MICRTKNRKHSNVLDNLAFSVLGFLVALVLIPGCSKKKPTPPDAQPPSVERVFSFNTTRVLVSFTEEVKPSLALDTLNYLIASYETLNVHHVNIDPMNKNCILVTARQESTLYAINVNNVEDISGNQIKDTTITFFGIGLPLDSIPPTMHIIEPVEGDTLYAFEYFSVNASDNTTGIMKASFYINDSLVGEDTTYPYFSIMDVRNITEGSTAKIYATCEDFGRNTGYSETLSVFIGFHPPFPYVIVDTIETGHIPFRMDITRDGKKVFFAKNPIYPYSTSSELIMLDTETNNTDTKVSLNPAIPIYFLDVFGNNWVYFTHNNSFSVYDITLDQVTETVNIGGTAQGIVRASNTNLYIARTSRNDIVIFDTQGNSILDSIPLPGGASALAVDTLHNELYACLEEDNLVSVIDLNTYTVITNIAIQDPYEVIFSPDFAMAYISEMSNNSVGIIDATTHTLLNEISPPGLNQPKGLSITEDGEYLFITSMINNVYAINTTDYSVRWKFNLGYYPVSLVFTASDEKLYVICQGSCEIYCMGY